jgi:hypothetical protein
LFSFKLEHNGKNNKLDCIWELSTKGNLISKVQNASFDPYKENPEYIFNIYKFKDNNGMDLFESENYTFIKIGFKDESIPHVFYKICYPAHIKNKLNKFNFLEKGFKSVNLKKFPPNFPDKIKFFSHNSKNIPYTLHILLETFDHHAHYGSDGCITYSMKNRKYLDIDVLSDNVHKFIGEKINYYKFFKVDEDDYSIIILKYNLDSQNIAIFKYYKNRIIKTNGSRLPK